MNAVLIFAGTTEGRRLAELLSAAGVCCKICVATEYGKLVMPELKNVQISVGRMDERQMAGILKEGFVTEEGGCLSYTAVVDATHPYATEVSENIKKSVEMAAMVPAVPYLRLKRDNLLGPEYENDGTNIKLCFDNEECALELTDTKGNILLTTGSKELPVYCEKGLQERLFVRVLPAEENIALCREYGISGRQIAAMQGPFSKELNLALIKQFDIRHLVTKESGTFGGVAEKIQAAREAGICVWLIGAPKQDEGMTFHEVLRKLQVLTDIPLMEQAKTRISLIGTGMGRSTMTVAARDALEHADLVFGAKRMLEMVPAGKEIYPYYLAEDIIPVLLEKKEKGGGFQAAVLFSGDTGFYSGSKKLKEELKRKGFSEVEIYAGVSAVSYLASALGVSWDDAKILSIHGKKDTFEWQAQLVESVMHYKKTFVLVSGVEDIPQIGQLLTEAGLGESTLFCGCRLSDEGEKITETAAKHAVSVIDLNQKGPYTLMIQNPYAAGQMLSPGLSDSVFVRQKVPMTKEEIREVCVCKLGLTGQSVVYDVGSGTGSVAVECAGRSADIRVYAIERKPEALALVKENCKKFHLHNVRFVLGSAPAAMQELEAPTHVFVGGSGGAMQEIISLVWEKNLKACIVATAISLETVAEMTKIRTQFSLPEGYRLEMETIQLQVSRGRQTGNSHLMQAENPVYIFRMKLIENISEI